MRCLQEVADMAAAGRFDYLVIESTGGALHDMKLLTPSTHTHLHTPFDFFTTCMVAYIPHFLPKAASMTLLNAADSSTNVNIHGPV